MAEKIKVTRGIYMGGLDSVSGKLLLMRRTKTDSLLKGVSFRGNWELIGGAVMTTDEETMPYNYYFKELDRLVKEKTGIILKPGILPMGMPCVYNLPFKGKDDQGVVFYDEATVVPVFLPAAEEMKSSVCELMYVSPTEVFDLASQFKPANEKKNISGEGLLSGFKRMFFYCEATLTDSPNRAYAKQAEGLLREFMKSWP